MLERTTRTAMQWTMNENSLFAILLRSSCVWSFMIAAVMIGVMMAVLPEAYRIVGVVSGLPFVVIGGMSRGASCARPPPRASRGRTRRCARCPGASSGPPSEAYRREAYDVQSVDGPADLELRKEWRRALDQLQALEGRSHRGRAAARSSSRRKEAREAHEVHVRRGRRDLR
jgi:restriction system protein